MTDETKTEDETDLTNGDLPERIRTADLERVFGGKKAVAAILEEAKRLRKEAKPKAPANIAVHVKPGDYGLAVAALEGRVTRETTLAVRHTAIQYALSKREEFAGWLEAQTVIAEHTDEEPETPDTEPDGEPVDDEGDAVLDDDE